MDGVESPKLRTLPEHARAIIRTRVPVSAEAADTLSRQLIQAVLRNAYAGDAYRDVGDPLEREALRTYSAWRGRGGGDQPQYEEWVGWLRTQTGLEYAGENIQFLQEILRTSGSVREGENIEHFLRSQPERVVVPAIYRGLIRKLEGVGEERGRGERVREPVLLPQREEVPSIAIGTNVRYNFLVPIAPESPKGSSDKPKEKLERALRIHNPQGLWGQMIKNLMGEPQKKEPSVEAQPVQTDEKNAAQQKAEETKKDDKKEPGEGKKTEKAAEGDKKEEKDDKEKKEKGKSEEKPEKEKKAA